MRRLTGDGGAVAVIVALFAVLMLILGSLVVELASSHEVRRQAQAAADAAALAAAGELYSPTGVLRMNAAYTAARRYAHQNLPAGRSQNKYFRSPCPADLPVAADGSWLRGPSPTNCLLFFRKSTTGRYTKVRIVTPGVTTSSLFGGVQGQTRAAAQASVDQAINSTEVLYGSDACGLSWAGGSINITGRVHGGQLITDGGTVDGALDGVSTYGATLADGGTTWTPSPPLPVAGTPPVVGTPDPTIISPTGNITWAWLRTNNYVNNAGRLDPGVYVTPLDVDIDVSLSSTDRLTSPNGGVTFLAGGSISLHDGAVILRPPPGGPTVALSAGGGTCLFPGITLQNVDVDIARDSTLHSPNGRILITDSSIDGRTGISIVGAGIEITDSALDLAAFPRTFADAHVRLTQ